MTVTCLADIAARLCGRDLSDISESSTHSGARIEARQAWRRAPRTKAALAAKVLAIEEAVRVLEDWNVPYTQPLFGKLVIEPPPGLRGASSSRSGPRRSVSGSLDGQRRDSKTFVRSSKLSRIKVTRFRVTCPDVQVCLSHRDCRRRNACGLAGKPIWRRWNTRTHS